jgi:dihydroflavonol-4-reductase
VVQCALKKKVRILVHVSSMSVFGMQNGRVNEESPKLGATSWINYQRSKYLAEQEILAGVKQGLAGVIINPASIMGPYDLRGWARFIRMADTGKIPGIPPGGVSFCHSREVVRTLIRAVEHAKTGENYLLGGTDARFVDLVRIIGRTIGCAVPQKTAPTWLLKTLSRIIQLPSLITGREPMVTPEGVALTTREMYADCSKAVRELGFQAVPLETMVLDSYQWLRDEGHVGR